MRVHERPICDHRLETSLRTNPTSLAAWGNLLKITDVCVTILRWCCCETSFLGRVGFLIAVPRAATGGAFASEGRASTSSSTFFSSVPPGRLTCPLVPRFCHHVPQIGVGSLRSWFRSEGQFALDDMSTSAERPQCSELRPWRYVWALAPLASPAKGASANLNQTL